MAKLFTIVLDDCASCPAYSDTDNFSGRAYCKYEDRTIPESVDCLAEFPEFCPLQDVTDDKKE